MSTETKIKTKIPSMRGAVNTVTYALTEVARLKAEDRLTRPLMLQHLTSAHNMIRRHETADPKYIEGMTDAKKLLEATMAKGRPERTDADVRGALGLCAMILGSIGEALVEGRLDAPKMRSELALAMDTIKGSNAVHPEQLSGLDTAIYRLEQDPEVIARDRLEEERRAAAEWEEQFAKVVMASIFAANRRFPGDADEEREGGEA